MGKSALGIAIRAVRPEIRLLFSFDAEPARLRPKRTQTGGGGFTAGCCGAFTACPARTQVPWARSGAVLGPFGRVWGRGGAEWGSSPELKTRLRGGHHWVRPTLARFSFVACLLLVACLFLLWGEGV